MLLFAALIAMSYFALYIWDIHGRDPASTLYLYQSMPGIMLCALSACAGIWFVVAITLSYNSEDDTEKKSLYKSIGIVYSFWFWTLPAIVLIATLFLDPWVRLRKSNLIVQN
jgi:hypothetical protein